MRKIKSRHIISLLTAGTLLLIVVLSFGPYQASLGSADNQPLFSSLDTFVLFASDTITLEQEVQISSGDIGSNNELEIEKDIIINGNLFANEIDIEQNTQVNGNVSSNELELEKGARIFGETISPIFLPIADLPDIPDIQPGTQDFIFKGGNNTLPSGVYRTVTIKKDATLTLTGDTYTLASLILQKNATLVFTAPTILNIAETFIIDQHSALLPAANNLSPLDLTINYEGREQDEEDEEDRGKEKDDEDADTDEYDASITFDKNSFLNFKLLAPNASVTLEKQTTFRGQILAKEIEVERDSILSREDTFVKIASPADIITDPDGGVYPINEILVSLLPGATIDDAIIVANTIGGRIVGLVSSINLYQIEVPTRTIEGLEAIIDTLRGRTDLKIDGVFRNFLLPTI